MFNPIFPLVEWDNQFYLEGTPSIFWEVHGHSHFFRTIALIVGNNDFFWYREYVHTVASWKMVNFRSGQLILIKLWFVGLRRGFLFDLLLNSRHEVPHCVIHKTEALWPCHLISFWNLTIICTRHTMFKNMMYEGYANNVLHVSTVNAWFFQPVYTDQSQFLNALVRHLSRSSSLRGETTKIKQQITEVCKGT